MFTVLANEKAASTLILTVFAQAYAESAIIFAELALSNPAFAVALAIGSTCVSDTMVFAKLNAACARILAELALSKAALAKLS
jgi:hypothetical protein